MCCCPVRAKAAESCPQPGSSALPFSSTLRELQFASAFISAFVMSMWYKSDSRFNNKVMSFGALYQALFKQRLGLSPECPPTPGVKTLSRSSYQVLPWLLSTQRCCLLLTLPFALPFVTSCFSALCTCRLWRLFLMWLCQWSCCGEDFLPVL